MLADLVEAHVGGAHLGFTLVLEIGQSEVLED
jgi:hypothetical protein